MATFSIGTRYGGTLPEKAQFDFHFLAENFFFFHPARMEKTGWRRKTNREHGGLLEMDYHILEVNFDSNAITKTAKIVGRRQISVYRFVFDNVVGWGLAPTGGNMLDFRHNLGEYAAVTWHGGGKPPPYSTWLNHLKQRDKYQFHAFAAKNPAAE